MRNFYENNKNDIIVILIILVSIDSALFVIATKMLNYSAMMLIVAYVVFVIFVLILGLSIIMELIKFFRDKP